MAACLMRSCLPLSYNRLAYPAGRVPGVDPDHPASKKLALSAVSTGKNFIDLARGVKANSISTGGAFVDGTLGLATRYSGSFTSWATFSSVPFPTPRVATTAAGIFRSTSASDQQAIVGIGNSYDNLLFYTTDTNFVSWYDGTQHTVTSMTVATNTPYFLAASANAAGVNFVLKNLATGQVQSEAYVGAIIFPNTGTDVTIGADIDTGGSDDMGGFVAAAMMSLSYMSVPELLAWADDPWAFWYPRQTQMLVSTQATAQYTAFSTPQHSLSQVVRRMVGY